MCVSVCGCVEYVYCRVCVYMCVVSHCVCIGYVYPWVSLCGMCKYGIVCVVCVCLCVGCACIQCVWPVCRCVCWCSAVCAGIGICVRILISLQRPEVTLRLAPQELSIHPAF